MSFEDIPFKSAPNFKFQEIIADKSDCLSSTYQFDCYKDKTGRVILISPFFDFDNPNTSDYHIRLINLENKEVLKKLEGHSDRVSTVRYFQDPNDKKDYFVSADVKGFVFVWDLTDDCKKCDKIYEVETQYWGFIYSCLLFFRKKEIFLVTSSISVSNVQLYKVDDLIHINRSPTLRLKDSRITVYFMANWYNENSDQNIIIQCSIKKIIFTEYPKNETYYTLNTEKKYPYNQGGIVFKNNNKDLFVHSCTYGLVQIFDLVQKQILKSITMEDDVHLYSFIFWNEHYLLLNDCLQKRIIVFDIFDDYKVKSKVLCPKMEFDRFIKKIDHPIYGESILSIGYDWKIKLFVNRCVI